jgi:PAS domain S-box-containing protein
MNLVSLLSYQLTDEGKGKKPQTRQQSIYRTVEGSRLSLSAARAGSWACDLTTGEAYYSDELCEALGLTPSSNQGGHWLERLHPEDRERAQSDLQRAISERRDFECDYRVLRPDGGLCWTQSRGWVLYDREGRPRQMIGLGLDITARKQRELESDERLAGEKSAREAAEALNRKQGEFLKLVTHELRSTLSAILGWSKILMSKPRAAEMAERACAVIERCARMQERVIEDLAALTLLESGKLRLDMQPVDLSKVIATTIEMARPMAASKGVELHARLAPDTGCIQGDPARLQQVVWNLLTNAIKFTPRGGDADVELRRDGQQLSLILRDTGIGIAPDVLPYIFDRYCRASSAEPRRGGGLGLGLAIVRELVRLHGGTIDAESPGENRGATFTVRLPYPTSNGCGDVDFCHSTFIRGGTEA